jgi:hypothetical protein
VSEQNVEFLAEVQKHRREAIDRMLAARKRGHAAIAEGYERVIASWDEMLGRHGVEPEGK